MTPNREAMTLERVRIRLRDLVRQAPDEMDSVIVPIRELIGFAHTIDTHLRAAEPVYQWRHGPMSHPDYWKDCAHKEEWEHKRNSIQDGLFRILYTHPSEPAVKSADEPRDVLLDQSLRQRAHSLRREACSAWSAVAIPCDHIDEAKCQYAAAQEKYLESVIDELADLTHPSEDARDAARLEWLADAMRMADLNHILGCCPMHISDLRTAIDAAMNGGDDEK